MEELSSRKCEPCHSGGSPLSDDDIGKYTAAVPEWGVEDIDGINRLTRTFKFKNFKDALEFTSKVGGIAEQEGHHPSILTEWGRVTVTWWTHAVKGLHVNDFIMASRTDGLYG